MVLIWPTDGLAGVTTRWRLNVLHLSDIAVGPLKAINLPGLTLCNRHNSPNTERCRIKKTLTMSPFQYTHHSPPLIANRTRTRASATQCGTGTAPAPHPAPHTPRTVSRRAVVVLRAPATSGLEPDLAERALSGTHIRPATGPLRRPSTCDSSSARCPRPTAPCGPPTVPISPAVAAVAAPETSADRLCGCLRSSQALQAQPRCRTCAEHESIMRTDIRRATRYRHSRPASPSPPRPLQRKPEGPGGAHSTGTLRLAAESS